ncbi:MAG: histidine phosphatase family protein [Clostridia bacterium]|nr:histidine phosphatase family protein [Clostridia bacterium]
MENEGAALMRNTIKKASEVLCSPRGAAYLVCERRRFVCLVRHGQTDWNVTRRLQGRESVPLNDTGRSQAEECGRMFRAARDAGLEIAGVFTSPLGRAKDSAKYVTDALGLGDAVTEELLNERDYGSLSGLTPEERRAKYTLGFHDPTIESVKDADGRMREAVALMSGKCGDGAIVAVTHGGVINALFVTVTAGRLGTGKSVSENCSVSLVAAGSDATIPLAYGLTGDDFVRYVSEYTAMLRVLRDQAPS